MRRAGENKHEKWTLQILKLNHQIGQVNEYLKRLGKPGEVDLEMIREILAFLKRAGLNKRSEEIIKGIEDDEVFEDQSQSGPHQHVKREIVIDGKVVAKRQGAVFTQEVAARRSFTHYRAVKEAALAEHLLISLVVGWGGAPDVAARAYADAVTLVKENCRNEK